MENRPMAGIAQPVRAGAPRWQRCVEPALLAAVLALGVVLLLTGGAPGAGVPGLPTRDLFDHLWLHEYLWQHLAGEPPGAASAAGGWQTRAIAWPEGGVFLHPDPVGVLWYGLVRPWCDPVGAATVSLAIQLWLAGLAAWALAARVTGSGRAGWVAGVAFACSPYLLGQALGGETETVSAWPLVLALLALEATARRPGWGRAAAAGALGGFAALASWYHGAFWILYTAAFLVIRLRRPCALAVVGAAGAVAGGPAWFYHRLLSRSDNLFQGPDMATYLAHHAEALGGMVSDPAGWTGLFPEIAASAGHVRAQYLGAALLILALPSVLAAFGRRRRDRAGLRWWSGVGVGALVLSLGPLLYVGGEPVEVAGGSLSLPYRLLVPVPLLGLMRIPHRWMILVALALSVLASHTVARLGRSGIHRGDGGDGDGGDGDGGDGDGGDGDGGDPTARRHAPALAVGLLVADLLLFGRVPLGARVDPSPPPVMEALPGKGAVLDLPPRVLGDDARGRYLVWQRHHGRPVPYALLMSAFSPTLAREPLLAAVAALDSRDPIASRVEDAARFGQQDHARAVRRLRRQGATDLVDAMTVALGDRRDALRGWGVDTVVLHGDLLEPGDAAQVRSLLEGALGAKGAERGTCVVWSLGPVPPAGEGS